MNVCAGSRGGSKHARCSSSNARTAFTFKCLPRGDIPRRRIRAVGLLGREVRAELVQHVAAPVADVVHHWDSHRCPPYKNQGFFPRNLYLIVTQILNGRFYSTRDFATPENAGGGHAGWGQERKRRRNGEKAVRGRGAHPRGRAARKRCLPGARVRPVCVPEAVTRAHTQASGATPTTGTTFERFLRTPQRQFNAPRLTRHRPPLPSRSQHERAKFATLLCVAAACACDPPVQRAVRGSEILRRRRIRGCQLPQGMWGGKSNIVSVLCSWQANGVAVTALCSLRSSA